MIFFLILEGKSNIYLIKSDLLFESFLVMPIIYLKNYQKYTKNVPKNIPKNMPNTKNIPKIKKKVQKVPSSIKGFHS